MPTTTEELIQQAVKGRVLVSVPEAARICGLACQTVYNAIATESGVISGRQLQTIKIGKRRLVRIQDLADWIDAHGKRRPGRPRKAEKIAQRTAGAQR